MQFKKGAEVLNADGEKLGDIGRVVIDPKGGRVSHIVIQKGFFFREDKVLPIDLFENSEADKVRLREEIDFEQMPNFLEVDYLPLNTDDSNSPDLAAPLYWYPMVGGTPMLYGSGPMGVHPPEGAGFPIPSHVEQNIPEGEIALEQGVEVVDQNGNPIGSVDRVIMNQKDNMMTHIVVTKGLLDQKKKLIPAHWISQIKEDGVMLGIDASLLDRLREYNEK